MPGKLASILKINNTEPALLLNEYEIDDDEAANLVSYLHENPHITDLYLASNKMSNIGIQKIATVSTLRRLDISNNKEFSNLACFARHKNLKHLLVSGCNITGREAKEFAQAFKNELAEHPNLPSQLQSIDVSENEIDDEGGNALAALPLDELNLQYNSLREGIKTTIIGSIRLDHNLRTLPKPIFEEAKKSISIPIDPASQAGIFSTAALQDLKASTTTLVPIINDKSFKFSDNSSTCSELTNHFIKTLDKKTNRQIHEKLIQFGLFKGDIALRKDSYRRATDATSREEYCNWAIKIVTI